MVKSHLMRRFAHIILLITTILGLSGFIKSHAETKDLSEGENAPPISRESIASALLELTEKKYQYKESDLEVSELTRWFREWLRKLSEKRNAGEQSEQSRLIMLIIFLSLAVIVLTSLVAIILLLSGWLQKGHVPSDRYQNRENDFFSLKGKGAWHEAGIIKAKEIAQQGRFREAISFLFNSLLRGLDSAGWIKFQKGQPSRLYLRQLRKSEELYPLFRDFLWLFELAYYREQIVTRESWENLLESYSRIAGTMAGSSRTS